jgi:hypothetical protein
MLTVVQRSPASREKPSDVVPGLASRLPWAWHGLCFAVPFVEPNRYVTRDLVSGATPSEWSGSITWNNKDGRANNTAVFASGSYMGFADTPQHCTPSDALTAYVRGRRTYLGATAVEGLLAKVHTVGSGTTPVTWAIQTPVAGHNNYSGSITVGGTNYAWDASGSSVSGAGQLNLFLRWASGEAPKITVLSDRGGPLFEGAYGTAVTGTLSYGSAQPLRINAGDDPATDGTPIHFDLQAMVWSRKLSDAELTALCEDPYGWYAPRRETIGINGPYGLLFGAGDLTYGDVPGGLI